MILREIHVIDEFQLAAIKFGLLTCPFGLQLVEQQEQCDNPDDHEKWNYEKIHEFLVLLVITARNRQIYLRVF